MDMGEFNKNGNNKIDELESHKTFIDKVLIKYKELRQKDFKINQFIIKVLILLRFYFLVMEDLWPAK